MNYLGSLVVSDDLQGSLENAAIYGAIQRGNNQRAQQMRPQGPPCPYCGGPIPRIGVELCMHCNHKLAWVDSTPCKPGEEAATRKKLKKHQEEKNKLRDAEIDRGLRIWGLLIALPAMSIGWINYPDYFLIAVLASIFGCLVFFLGIMSVGSNEKEAAKKQKNDRRLKQRKKNAAYAEETRRLQEKYMKKR